ncbi:MAG: DUF2029 domain-containing protein [Synergistaceae bacterium]|nr:DUF2029 domain-containing protein [Synergistaceae bacterium]
MNSGTELSSQVNLWSASRQKLYQLTFVALSVLSIIYLFFFSRAVDYLLCDLETQWRVCAYTLRGVDIYALRGSDDFIPEIGYIYVGFHASPWGCLLENVFYGGFLSYEAAKAYFITVNLTILLTASLVLRAKATSLNVGSWAFILSLFSLDFFASVSMGNAGGMICAFLLIAWLICDDHPYIAGVLVAFAMVKPQVALIVCVMFLMMRRVKPLITGAVVDISAWFAVSLLTGKGMFELLREFLFMSSEKVGTPFSAGIFTIMFDNFMYATYASMIAGVIFVAVLYALLPRNMPEMFKIYPAFMAVAFWCYSQANDNYVHVLPACVCVWLLTLGNKRLLWLLCAMWCSFGLHIRSGIRRLIMLADPVLTYGDSARFAMTLYELVIIAIGFMICVELRRIYGGADS